MNANRSERHIGKVDSCFYALRFRNAFVFQARIVTEIHQKTKFKSGCVQIVQELRAMFVSSRGHGFEFDNNFPKANIIRLVSLL